MRRIIVSCAAGLTLLVGLLATTALPAHAGDMDCGDFPTQQAAQTFFLNAGPGDPHNLDAEGDGAACESNPCPCGGTPVPTTSTDGSGNHAQVIRQFGTVVKVTDGDTLKVRVAGLGVRDVRVLGIDTPETHGRSECGGEKASRAMRGLAPVGSRVVLTSDTSQAQGDRYGRLLRYVERNGRDVGRAQVYTGFARVYVYRSDPFRRTADYRRVERQAKARHRGLWAYCWKG